MFLVRGVLIDVWLDYAKLLGDDEAAEFARLLAGSEDCDA